MNTRKQSYQVIIDSGASHTITVPVGRVTKVKVKYFALIIATGNVEFFSFTDVYKEMGGTVVKVGDTLFHGINDEEMFEISHVTNDDSVDIELYNATDYTVETHIEYKVSYT